MKIWLALLPLLLIAADTPEEKAGPNDNKPPAGFQALFNGKDLSGWQGVVTMKQRLSLSGDQLAERQQQANEKVLPHWSAPNGVLVYDGKGDSLQTAKDYGN